jgi:hypothetical protein
MRPIIALSAALAATIAIAAPAAAQDAAGDKVNQLIIYGEDTCPQSTTEITVCARKPETERYRIPEMFRGAESPQNEAWTNKVLAYETVGRSGTQSCSPVGGGGWTGCANQLINAAYQEKREAPDVRFAELIAAERAKRLATIDADAAATQARVESLEKQYEARLKAEDDAREAASAPATDAPLPQPK